MDLDIFNIITDIYQLDVSLKCMVHKIKSTPPLELSAYPHTVNPQELIIKAYLPSKIKGQSQHAYNKL